MVFELSRTLESLISTESS